MSEIWIDFEGDRSGCDDDCRGWDGQERRCDCGNRRVSWSCIEDKCKCITDNETANCPNAYAEAW